MITKGVEEIHENWGLNLGEEIDDGGDPPRIWSKHGKYPGCAFTRSIGDALSERLGVFAEPELEEYTLGDEDKYIIIASDGVWEFLTSQSVADMVDKFPDPLDACRHVVAQSYSLWLQYEDRTDDITMIALYIDEFCAAEPPTAPLSASAAGGRKFSRKISNFELHSNPMENIVNQRKQSMQRPLGSGGDRRRRRHRAIIRKNEEELTKDLEDEEEYLVADHMVKKTDQEVKRIESAVRANFLFHHLDKTQRKNIFSVMTKVDCRAGQRLILQGDKGDRFYIVDSGEYFFGALSWLFQKIYFMYFHFIVFQALTRYAWRSLEPSHQMVVTLCIRIHREATSENWLFCTANRVELRFTARKPVYAGP